VNAVVIWLLRLAERRLVAAGFYCAVGDRKILAAQLPDLPTC